MSSSLPNPFAVPVNTPTPKSPAPRDAERWGIAASGPPVDPAELETTESAVEVVILWGAESVLHVEHVSPPRDVVIGEGGNCPAFAELLGAPRQPVVVKRGDALCCVVPEGAEGTVTVGTSVKSFTELAADGKLSPYAELAGAQLFPLPDGATARVEHRGLTFLVRPTNAGRAVAASAPVQWRRYSWIAASLSVHAIVLMFFYFLPPTSQALSLDPISSTDRMVQFMTEAPSVLDEPEPEFTSPESGEVAGDEGAAHADAEGAMGSEDAPRTNNAYAVQGDHEDRALARENVAENMEQVGAIGALSALMGTWDTPTSPFGAAQARGGDISSALGALMGEQTGENFGQGGLGMHGTGRGGGGFGEGSVGVGNLNTLGHGCRGGNCAPGSGRYGETTGISGERTSRVPPPRSGPVTVVGSMSRETIRRIVQRHISEVRFCYEQGLQQNPSLEGRITVNWIISPTGAVSSSRVVNSTVSNGRVEQCIASSVQRWSFPQPDGGSPVGVNYPFILNTH